MEPLISPCASRASWKKTGGPPSSPRKPAFAAWYRAWAASIVLALAACGGAPDPGPEAAARDFLTHLAAGRTEEAWAMTAFLFQVNSSEAVFDRAARDYQIRGAADIDLGVATEGPQRTRFTGTYRTAEAFHVPFEIEMAKERGLWKVLRFAVRLGPEARKIEAFSALADLEGLRPPDDQPVPNETELRELARLSLLDFAEAVAAEDFSAFYEKTSEIWKAQTSPVRLKSRFEAFRHHRVDLREALRNPPQLTAPPDVDRKGILTIKGAFPYNENTIHFETRFRYELPRWRLFGLALSVELSGAEPPPAAAPQREQPAG